MTTSRANSNGVNPYILARRRERQAVVDHRNERVTNAAIKAGRSHAIILHPTKGFRRVALDKPRPFTGVKDWWARVIAKHIHGRKK